MKGRISISSIIRVSMPSCQYILIRKLAISIYPLKNDAWKLIHFLLKWSIFTGTNLFIFAGCGVCVKESLKHSFPDYTRMKLTECLMASSGTEVFVMFSRCFKLVVAFLVGELEAPINVEISRKFLLLFFYCFFPWEAKQTKNADQATSVDSNKTTFDSKSVDS